MVIIPLWPENNCILILHSCIILCVFSGSPAEVSSSVPAVSPGEHHCYSNMDTKGPLLSWLFFWIVKRWPQNQQHIKIKAIWTCYQGQRNNLSKLFTNLWQKVMLTFKFPIKILKKKLYGRGKCNVLYSSNSSVGSWLSQITVWVCRQL